MHDEEKPKLDYASAPRPTRVAFTRDGINLFRRSASLGLISLSLLGSGVVGFLRGQGSAELGALIVVGILGVCFSIKWFRAALRATQHMD